jgi:S1-C subfamily serine protease
LLVQSGPNEVPHKRRFEERVVTIGRDPSSSLRFAMATDLNVSTRHAEIQELDDGGFVIVDKKSTNGTWVNGGRVHDVRSLNPGDVINLGRAGPKLRVLSLNDEVWHETVEDRLKLPPLHTQPSWRPHRTRDWIVNAIESRTRTLKFAVAGSVAGVLVLALVGWLYVRTVRAEDPDVWREVTIPAIRKANDDAVVLIETEIPEPNCARGCEGTGFAITPDGLIVTNRHVVIQNGVRATRVRVKFANTGAWIPASLQRVAENANTDLALLHVDQPGRYPTVVGVSATGPDLPIGSAVMTIGFPLGTRLTMEGSGVGWVAKTTMTTGSIGKMLDNLFQIDVTADHGSSGSPVFDRHGHAIGVVSGGARGDADKIVYVVPSNLIWQLRKGARS